MDILGYLVTLWPNGFGELNQIWHASSHGSGASSCKILDTYVNCKYCYLGKKAPKMLKKSQIWVFSHICHSMTIRIIKFGMNKLASNMNPHVKSQNTRFCSFEEIRFWMFSKILQFLILDIFLKKSGQYRYQHLSNLNC